MGMKMNTSILRKMGKGAREADDLNTSVNNVNTAISKQSPQTLCLICASILCVKFKREKEK